MKSKKTSAKKKKTFFMTSFTEENKLWRKGYIVIGVDEVGRGALAGPVVTGAVAFKVTSLKSQVTSLPVRIDDSKRMKPVEREISAKWIKKNALGFAVGQASVSYINKQGIVKATHKAFRIAIKKLLRKVHVRDNSLQKVYLLADAFHIKYVKGIGLKNQKAIVKGDQKSYSIAAASIIAKVFRDRLMEKLGKGEFNIYGWFKNKGYGTKSHMNIIRKSGITTNHRKRYVKNFIITDLE